jgi:integrase
MRRNECLALRWQDFDAKAKTLRIERSVEQVGGKLSIKGPKRASHKRTIAISDDLVSLLMAVREKHLRFAAGLPDGVTVDLSLIRLGEDALIFPKRIGGGAMALRCSTAVSSAFRQLATKLGYPKLRLHDLRGSHETCLLDGGVPVHVVAARCGHDPAVLLKVYAKRTKKADESAAAAISALSAGVLS